MRKIALLTAAFTFALSGVAFAATTWYGGPTQRSDVTAESGQFGIDIGLNGSGKEVTHVDVHFFVSGTGSCSLAHVATHGLTWKVKHGSFKGTETSQGVKIKVTGKLHDYKIKGTYTVTEGSCKSGTVKYTAKSEFAAGSWMTG